MHPTEREDLTAFVKPFLAMKEGEDTWRTGRFQIREGPTSKEAKTKVANIHWHHKNGEARAVDPMVRECEDAIDLLTAEAHDRIWVFAYYKGDSNPKSWRSVVEADGPSSGHHRKDMEDALAARMRNNPGLGTALAVTQGIALLKMTDSNRDLLELYVEAIQELAVVKAMHDNKAMLLEGALAAVDSGELGMAHQEIAGIVKTYAPHLGPALAQMMLAFGPTDLPAEPGARIDYYLSHLEAHLMGMAQTAQSSPQVMTDERKRKIAHLIGMVMSWHTPQQPTE